MQVIAGRCCLVRQTALLVLLLGVAACDAPATPPPATSAVTATPAPAAPPPAPAVDVGPPAVSALHVFTGGAQKGDKVPLVVAIHGLGDAPQSFKGLVEGFPGKAHFVVPAGGLSWGDGYAWWPIRGAIDDKNMAAGIEAAADRLAGGLRQWHDDTVAGKPIVTGFSQGGMLSFALGAKYPAMVGEAIPIAGLLPPSMLPPAWPAGAPMPRFVALHGDADQRVPYSLGKKSVELLQGLGVPAELRSYPGMAHVISADMRRDLWQLLQAAVERAAKAG